MFQKRNLHTEEKTIKPEEWLWWKIEDEEDKVDDSVFLPKNDDDEEFSPDMLETDQLQIFVTVMRKLKEWIETDDLSNFKPLRMILNGSGGSGKSVVVNTIVTAMRKMFNCNDVVKVAAPTGTAAYNVGGETSHHLLSIMLSK